MWFLWLLVLVVAVAAGIFFVKRYVVDRQHPEKIAPTTDVDQPRIIASTVAPLSNQLDSGSATRGNVSLKYKQLIRDGPTSEEMLATPMAAKISEKEKTIREEDNNEAPLQNNQERPLVVNVMDALGNLRAPSHNSSVGSVEP